MRLFYANANPGAPFPPAVRGIRGSGCGREPAAPLCFSAASGLAGGGGPDSDQLRVSVLLQNITCSVEGKDVERSSRSTLGVVFQIGGHPLELLSVERLGSATGYRQRHFDFKVEVVIAMTLSTRRG